MLKSLSSRLAISYVFFFALSSLLIFGVLFYSVAQFMEQKDHDIIEARFQQYQELFENEGIQGLRHISTNHNFQTQSARFLIYLKDPERNPIFVHLPEEHENFNIKDLQKTLRSHKVDLKETWFNIASKDGDEDALEVRSATLEKGYSLYVGARTDSRDEILEKILNIFMFLLVPLLLVATVGAFFIGKKSLRPVHNLIKTISSIKDGDLSSRVPMHESLDELHELGSLFNDMIERVEELVTAMKDTLDNVAHDLKTPITRLKMAGELALRTKDDSQVRMALSEAIENSEEILNLVNTIMTVSEISAKTVKLKVTEFDLGALIEEVIDVYFFVAEEKSIQINFDVASSFDIRADRSLLRQAVANLLDNALKYSKNHSEVDIQLHKDPEQVVLEIVDQGIGISANDLPRIWERLFRGDKSRRQPGLGLGLSLVRAIVEAHRGKVEVQSEDGRGSKFIVRFPK